MREVVGDIWSFASKGWIVVTTNSVIKSNGEAVMGAGIALEAAQRFPNLPRELANRLRTIGNYVHYFMDYKIVTFPTKRHWKDKSELDLIIAGAAQLKKDLLTFRYQQRPIQYFLPRLGCGNGGLAWPDVAKAITPYLDEPEFTFVVRG
jgi:hypothetical protein